MIIHIEQKGKTFEEALAILRNEKEKKIIVHGGTYYGTSIKLTEADSGLTIEAAGGECPVLSGSVVVDNWQKDEKNGWFYAKSPSDDFRMMSTADGRYLKKARYPLSGVLTYKDVFTAAEWVGSHAGGWQRALLDDELNHFEYDPKDIPEDFDWNSAEVQLYHSWNESYCKIERQDKKNNIFRLTPNATYPPGSLYSSRYAIYNTKEGMGEEGRWYCDRNTDTIWYRPMPGERAEDFKCFVPITTRVISLEGCSDITIKGLHITGATTPVVNEQYQHPCQIGGAGFGVMEQSGAVMGSDLKNITVEDCEVYMTGGHGLMLRGESIWIRRCRMHHCGAGGVGISVPDSITPETQNNTAWSCVEDCDIREIGVDYFGAAGIFSNSAMVRRNRVCETPYTSIIANGNYNVVEDNICINPMLVLSDGAGIYMHINEGCIVRRNVCINTNSKRETKAFLGIYLDSQTGGYELYENYIRGFERPILDARRGSTNNWHDNYFEYNGEEGMVIKLPCDKGITFHRNIVRCSKLTFYSHTTLFDAERDMRDNVFYCKNIDMYKYEGTDEAMAKSVLQKDFEIGESNIIK